MKKSAVALLCCVAGFLNPERADAQEAIGSQEVAKIREIFDSHASYFSKIGALTFVGSETFQVLQGEDKGKKITKSIEFIGKGDKFRYKFEQVSEFDGGHLSDASSYDGRLFQTFKPPLLTVSQGCPSAISSLFNMLFFTMPFDFVQTSVAATNPEAINFVLRPNQFQDVKNWAAAQSRIVSISEGVVQGKRGLVLKLTGSFAGKAAKTSVLLDPEQDYYPVAWERFTGENVGLTYVVSEFATVNVGGQNFRYPKRASRNQYTGSPEPVAASSIIVEKVLINQTDIDDDEFTIDPTRASFIYDATNKQTIRVPN